MLRKHQRDMMALCQDVLAGVPVTQVLAQVTPGGGKSLLPVILAHQLIPAVADALCWVVPRIALQEQGEGTFGDPAVQQLLQHSVTARAAGNDIDPCRGHKCYITTYQAIAADPQLHLDEFRRKRYLLVLDEPHHVEDNGVWHRALQPLVDQAVLTVLMSGSWERGDSKRIAFVPYISVEGGSTPDLMPAATSAVITYGRGDALRERAIRPLRLMPLDGRVEWVDKHGETQQVQSLAEADEHVNNALYTALNTNFAFQLLDRCIEDWQAKLSARPTCKLLVVAANIARAQDYLKYVTQRGLTRVAIATSDDGVQAREAIARFKRVAPTADRCDVLITVAMAYEGLDVPAISHIACLTHIRSRTWIEQMAARAARVERAGGPYEEQSGVIYAPDDSLLLQIFDDILAEQQAVVRSDRVARDGLGSSNAIAQPLPIIPIASALTRERAFDLASGEGLGYDETASIQAFLRQHGLVGIDPIAWKRAFLAAGGSIDRLPAAPTQPNSNGSLLTPRQREAQLRGALERYCREYDLRAMVAPGTMASAIQRAFGKSRSQMTEAELQEAWAWARGASPGL